MKIKVYGGTPRANDPFLCKTCTHATYTRSSYENEDRVFCNYVDRSITTRIIKCSDYKERMKMGLMEMRELAWVIRTTKSGKAIGFLSPLEAKDKLGEHYNIPTTDEDY